MHDESQCVSSHPGLWSHGYNVKMCRFARYMILLGIFDGLEPPAVQRDWMLDVVDSIRQHTASVTHISAVAFFFIGDPASHPTVSSRRRCCLQRLPIRMPRLGLMRWWRRLVGELLGWA